MLKKPISALPTNKYTTSLRVFFLLLVFIWMCICYGCAVNIKIAEDRSYSIEKNKVEMISERTQTPGHSGGSTETASLILSPSPTALPILPASPSQSPIPTPIVEVKIIAIDAGHQRRHNYDQEAIGPNASQTKAKVSSGTAGVSTKIPEYELNLAVAFKLRDELIARGYSVVMIRETHDVDKSNIERANMAKEANADLFLRIHANGSTNQKKRGILMVAPPENSPYVSHLYEDCRRIAEYMLEDMVASSGAPNNGIWETNTMSGINWATMPVAFIEMGYMTNPEEDELLNSDEYQYLLVDGMSNAIDRFFARDG